MANQNIKTPSLFAPQVQAPTNNKPYATYHYNNKRPEKYKHVENLGDILLGNPFTGTKQLRNTLEDAGLGGLLGVPVLDKIVGTGLYLKEKYIEPTLKGNFTEVGINTLQAVSDDLDVLANPIKSLFKSAGGGSFDDFVNSLGLNANEYRQQYNFDTNNFLGDILLETLADPTTYLSLGGTAVVKLGSKEAAKELPTVVKTLVKTNLDETLEVGNEVYKKTLKGVLNNFSERTLKEEILKAASDEEAVEALIKRINNTRDYLQKIIKTSANEAELTIAKNLLNDITFLTNKKAQSSFFAAVAKARHSKGYSMYKAGLALKNAGDNIDKKILNMSIAATPVGGAKYIIKNTEVIKKMSDAIKNNVARNIDKYDTGTLIRKHEHILTEARNEIVTKAQAMYPELFKSLDDVLAKNGITFEDLIKEWFNNYNSLPAKKRNTKNLAEQMRKFLKTKLEYYTSLKTMAKHKDDLTELFKDIIVYTDEEAEDLIEATVKVVQQSADAYEAVADATRSKILKSQEKAILYNLHKPDNTDITTLSKTSILEGILKTNFVLGTDDATGVTITLEQLFQALASGHMDANRKDMILRTLSFIGVNEDNYKQIDDIISMYKTKSISKKEMQERINIILKPNTISYLDARKVAYYKKETQKIIDEITKKYHYYIDDKAAKEFITALDNNSERMLKYAETLDIKIINSFINVKDKLTKLINTTNINVPEQGQMLDLILNELDDVFYYAGGAVDAESPSELIKNFLKFADKEDLEFWHYTQEDLEILQNMRRFVSIWNTQITDNLNLGVSSNTQQFIKDLYVITRSNEVAELTSDILDVITTNTDFAHLQMSKHGMYSTIMQSLRANQDTKNYKLLMNLADITNPLYQNMTSLLNTLREINNPLAVQLADSITTIITAVQNSNAIDAALDEMDKLLSTYAGILTKEERSFLRNQIWETIYSLKDKPIAETTKADLLKHYQTELTYNINSIRKRLKDNIQSLDPYAIPDELESLNNKFDEVLSNIISCAETVFSNFLKTERIDLAANLGVSLMDNRVVRAMNSLGFNVPEVLNMLITNNITDTQLNNVIDVILAMSGTKNKYLGFKVEDLPAIVIERFTKNIEQEWSDAIVESIDNYAEQSISRLITQTYTDIRRINSTLRQGLFPELISNNIADDVIKRYKDYKIYNVAKHYTINEITDTIKKVSGFTNMYTWSVANGFLGFKRDTYTGLNIFKQLKNATTMSAADAQVFLDRYSYYLDKYKNQFDKNKLRKIRKALIKTYQDSSLIYVSSEAPELFFSKLTDAQVYAFHRLTKDANISRNAANKYNQILNKYLTPQTKIINGRPSYSVEDKLRYYRENTDYIEDLDEYLNKVPTEDTDTMTQKLIEDLPLNYWDDLKQAEEHRLDTLLKDKDTMLEHVEQYQQYINKDKSALNNLDTLVNLEKKYKGKEHILSYAKRERERSLLNTFINWTPKQQRAYIDNYTPGVLYIIGNEVKQLNKKELNALGITVSTVRDHRSKGPVITALINKQGDAVTTLHTFNKIDSVYQDIQDSVTDVFKKNEIYFDSNVYKLPFELMTGDEITKSSFETILRDTRIQKSCTETTKITSNNFWKTRGTMPSTMFLGTNAQNTILDFVQTQNPSSNLQRTSSSLTKSVANANFRAIKTVNNRTKWMSCFINDDFSINNDLFTKMFKDASDTDIKEFFSKYRCAILGKDSKGLPKVVEFRVNNKKTLQEAKKLKAVVLPYECLRNMTLTVNNKALNKLSNAYNSVIVGTFKTMYLNTLGFLMRNFYDSMFVKNLTSTEGLSGLAEVMHYEHQASKYWKWFNEQHTKILEMSNGQTINIALVRKHLSTLSREERKLYMLLDTFSKSDASGGLTQAMTDFIKSKGSKTENWAWVDWYTENVLGKHNPFITPVRDANNWIEQTARLGLFLNLVDKGTSTNEAIRKVVATHFDYDFKNPLMGKLEHVFWFSTFPLNNLAYYMNYGLEQNLDVFKLQMDMLQTSYNSEGYTWDDIRNNNYLAYNALAGNLRFGVAGKDIILKTGSSVIDFFSLVTNPIEGFMDKLNPFISIMTGQEGLSALNPIQTQVNNFNTMLSGRSMIPSVYSTLYEKRKRTNSSYNKAKWTKYPKIRRTYGSRIQAKTYFKRYRSATKRTYLKTTSGQRLVTYVPVVKGYGSYNTPMSNKYNSITRLSRRLYRTQKKRY